MVAALKINQRRLASEKFGFRWAICLTDKRHSKETDIAAPNVCQLRGP